MEASCVHGQVEAFYAPRAEEGNHILQDYTSKSVEAIHGHSTRANLAVAGPEFTKVQLWEAMKQIAVNTHICELTGVYLPRGEQHRPGIVADAAHRGAGLTAMSRITGPLTITMLLTTTVMLVTTSMRYSNDSPANGPLRCHSS
jgi:hypothetical protein